MKRSLWVIVAVVLAVTSCVIHPERDSVRVVFESDIGDVVRARQVALRYQALVAPFQFNGHPIRIDKCTIDSGCDYRVTRIDGRCAESMDVKEKCMGTICTHEFSQGPVLCWD